MGGTRLATTALGAACLVALAGCGAGPGSRPARAGVTTSAPTTTTTTTAPPDLAYLTAYGATTQAWAANHEHDPSNSTGWWPGLPDGRDTYTSLKVAGGRVVGYTLALYPAEASGDAKARLASDLPLDASAASDKTLPGCELVVESSPTLAAAVGGRVLAELTSAGGSYDPAAVSTIVTSALPGAAPPPSSC